MNKNVIAGMMLATAAIFGTSAAYADQCKSTDCKDTNCKKEKCEPTKCNNCNKEARNPFAGLNLTTEQQSKLDALKAECKAKKDEVKKEATDRRNQAKKEMREDATKAKTEMLGKIKAILTPEQYVQFLENTFVQGNSQGNRQGFRKDQKGRHDKGFKGAKTGDGQRSKKDNNEKK